MIRTFLIAAATFSAALCAHAQISPMTIETYNVAVASGDGTLIKPAGAALGAAAIANPDDAQSDNAAFETAFTLCRLGFCEDAKPAADFVAGRPASEGLSAEIRALLSAYVDWEIKSNGKSTKAFNAALDQVMAGDPSMLSVATSRLRYLKNAIDGDFKDAEKHAALAKTHFEKSKDVLGMAYYEARTVEISSRFNHRPKTSEHEAMVHLRGELGQEKAKLGEEAPEWMDEAYWRADAWGSAMDAYFKSVGNRGLRDSKIEAILAGYEIEAPDQHEEGDDDKPPFCEGAMKQKPPMRYPSGNVRKGMYGSVIIGFNFDNGKVVDAKVLASVPYEGFKEAALETVSQWVYEPSEDPAVTGCRLDYEGVIQPLSFMLR